MSVAVATETLRTLHRIHRQLGDLEDQLAAGPREITARTRAMELADGRRKAAEDGVRAAKMAADAKQLQLKSSEAKIRDLEGKLNACKTNREYQTLQEQIAADRMATKVLEDEILESLERIDALKPTVPAAGAEVESARSLLEEARLRIATETTRLEGEVARIREQLDLVEKDLAADLRDVYLRVVKHKGAEGMAAADGETCSGCDQRITGNMMSELLLGRSVTCRSCGRLLYLSESATSV